MNKKIFVLEDDINISSIIEFNLRAQGFDVVCEFDGQKGLDLIKSEKPDLVVLDVMLPSLDGFSVLKKLRAFSDLPVIIVSARTDEQDKLEGLSLMADDYVTKPFSISELVARIKVNLARYEGVGSAKKVIYAGDIEIDTEAMTVSRDGNPISLTKKEFELLLLVAKNRGKVLSREDILQKVWGYGEYLGDLHIVDVTIGRLRAKIEKNPTSPEIILSRRGAGYFLP